jgi:hypothetical protein
MTRAPLVQHCITPPRRLETLYEAGIISTTELEEVLEGWSRYLRQR